MKQVGPLFTAVPTLMHVREVGHFSREGSEAFQLSISRRIYWGPVLLSALRRANHIVVVSGECKRVLVERFNIPNQKITIVYQGVDPRFRSLRDSSALDSTLRRYRLPPEYILVVGNPYPHKNYETVIRVFAALKHAGHDIPSLVVVGDRRYARPDLFELVECLGLSEKVVFPGYIHHQDLVHIYNRASLLLFPPLLASFPNPCLEAMACGVPVVAADRGAVSEITDGAALLVKRPRDVDEMAQAVLRVLSDRRLRDELRERGRRRVRDFSWEVSARQLMRLYRRVGMPTGKKRRNVNSLG
jgi:glycosyltransferase involved in cell wall biosynthesis